MTDATPKMTELCRIVFSTPDGKRLLELWDKYYVRGTLADLSPYETYMNIGRRDFILQVQRKAVQHLKAVK